MDREHAHGEAARVARLATTAVAVLVLELVSATPARSASSGQAPETSSPLIEADRDVCAEIEARLARRRQWLAERRTEQFARGGAPDPDLGIPDVTWQWCEAHPRDVDCNMPKVTVFFTTEELRGGQAPEEYDPHVILMKRELGACRGRERRERLPRR